MQRWLPSLIALFLFGFLSYLRLGEALFSPQTIAVAGDGFGTIGWMFDMNQAVREDGLGSIFGGAYYSNTIGAGLNLFGLPSSWLQRILYFVMGEIFGDINVYDAIAALAIILIGFSGYLLARAAKVDWTCSLLLGLSLVSLPVFNGVIFAHLFLANYYGAIFVCLGALCYGLKPTYKRLSILLVCIVCNFMISEYHGYFGAWVALGITLCSYFYFNSGYLSKKTFACHTLYAAAGLLLLMGFSSYDMILRVLLANTQSTEPIAANFQRLDFEYTLHAMHQPQSLFAPNLPFLQSFFPPLSHLKEGSEFLFRVGFIIPMTLLVAWIYAFRNRNKSVQNKFLLGMVSICLLGSMVAFCLALKPKLALSLVPVTQAIAPMFRVSVRALLYLQILMLLGFAYVVSDVLSRLRAASPLMWQNAQKVFFAALAAGLFWLAFNDLRPINTSDLYSKIATHSLPAKKAYIDFAAKNPAAGYLLELPFNAPGSSGPENDYGYYIGRTIHGMPIINGGMPFDGDLGSSLVRMQMIGRFNSAEPHFVETIRRLGVKYLSVHRQRGVLPEDFAKLEGLRPVVSEKDHAIFLVENTQKFSLVKLKNWVWDSDFSIYSHTLGSQEKETKAIKPQDFQNGYRLVEKKVATPSWLMFGPYVPLSRGRYEVRFMLDAKLEGAIEEDAIAYELDIVSDKEDLRIAESIPYKAFEKGELEKKVKFTLTRTGSIQVRLRTSYKGQFLQGNLHFKRLGNKQKFPLAVNAHSSPKEATR